ncbi:hypothetical protein MUY14_44305 [Amycolatopsis sp. FBCC-B4732]|uniref:hypothetical protein n=1 Tax=Amycolatopsis sp. FBCC-B4732 TaxID=3079339 RepID=UPI001FF5E16A|nr:hypothetical protein [Amycolatopsis sp. FBCC-B4732]UOX88621.1 hypothetical protein MUY14_44305 [Amycolatopsis sp. FBCC-B4732]
MNDFDFFIGSWTVTNRRLGTLLAGSDDWTEFPGTSTCWSLFEGRGNVDEITFPTLGSHGCTLRLFDVEREEWSLYWASSRDGLLQPPVTGAFKDGRGDFYGDDTYEGTPIKVHYAWTGTTTGSPRWEQAFSTDGGRTWESNWVMEFARA